MQISIHTLYNAIILPHIDYCCTIWTNAANKHVNRIQILQNRAARLTLGCKTRDIHTMDLYTKLNWMNINQRADYFRNILMYKCINGQAPEYLRDSIQSQTITQVYNTRFKAHNNLSHASVKTETGKRSFKYSGASSWNNLPHSIKILPNIHSFKG